jgi:Arc/MetJ-type ribon-helix-helix transcriptional regulator
MKEALFKRADIEPRRRLSMDGRMTIELPDDLNRKFRARVAEKYAGRKGALGEAVKEAIELWLEREKKK